MIGGDMIAANIKALRYGGRLVSIACMDSANVSFSMAGLLMKNLRWQGMTLRSQPTEVKARLFAEVRTHCWDAVAAGHIIPRIDRIYALEDAVKAHAYMRARKHIGKLVLQTA
jgi:NADPH:quinone reductase-like Zn-dependent oxidoreductase